MADQGILSLWPAHGEKDAGGAAGTETSQQSVTSDTVTLSGERCQCGNPLPPHTAGDPPRDPPRHCTPRCRTRAWRERRGDRPSFRRRDPLIPASTEEEARKREALDTAARNNRAQRTIARWAALMALGSPPRLRGNAREYGAGIVSHVRQWCEAHGVSLEWGKSWTGSLFQRHPWFERTGEWWAAFHRESNARPVREWRLTAEGWRAYRAARKVMG